MDEDEFAVVGGEPVVHNNVHPLTKVPEMEVEDASVATIIPALLLGNDLERGGEGEGEGEGGRGGEGEGEGESVLRRPLGGHVTGQHMITTYYLQRCPIEKRNLIIKCHETLDGVYQTGRCNSECNHCLLLYGADGTVCCEGGGGGGGCRVNSHAWWSSLPGSSSAGPG